MAEKIMISKSLDYRNKKKEVIQILKSYEKYNKQLKLYKSIKDLRNQKSYHPIKSDNSYGWFVKSVEKAFIPMGGIEKDLIVSLLVPRIKVNYSAIYSRATYYREARKAMDTFLSRFQSEA